MRRTAHLATIICLSMVLLIVGGILLSACTPPATPPAPTLAPTTEPALKPEPEPAPTPTPAPTAEPVPTPSPTEDPSTNEVSAPAPAEPPPPISQLKYQISRVLDTLDKLAAKYESLVERGYPEHYFEFHKGGNWYLPTQISAVDVADAKEGLEDTYEALDRAKEGEDGELYPQAKYSIENAIALLTHQLEVSEGREYGLLDYISNSENEDINRPDMLEAAKDAHHEYRKELTEIIEQLEVCFSGLGSVKAEISELLPVAVVDTPADKIVFVSERDGYPEIYLMNSDGSNPINLTNQRGVDREPTWSPDGRQIAFVSYRDGKAEIYLMDYNGANVKRITNTLGSERQLCFSPEGTQIAYVTYIDGAAEIFIMDADGSNQKQITDNPADDTHPSWSPDGKTIAFQSDRDGNEDVYTITMDGELTKQSHGLWFDGYPSWSPDGSQIAYTHEEQSSRNYVYPYMMQLNGVGEKIPGLSRFSFTYKPSWAPDGTRLVMYHYPSPGESIASYTNIVVCDLANKTLAEITSLDKNDYDPVWSPVSEGQTVQRPEAEPWVTTDPKSANTGRIVYSAQESEGAKFDLYVLDPMNGDKTQLTDNAANDVFPKWSPDGRKVAFVSDRDGLLNIYVMNADGTDQKALTSKIAYDTSPAWSPDGSKIVFVSTRYMDAEILVMDANGENVVRLTGDVGNKIHPSWSPDGTSIVYAARFGDEYDIYEMNARGGGFRRLVALAGNQTSPRYSPSGDEIVFVSNHDGSPRSYVMKFPDGEPQKVNDDFSAYTSWTHDGNQILYSYKEDGQWVIAISDVRGDTREILARDFYRQTNPDQMYSTSIMEAAEVQEPIGSDYVELDIAIYNTDPLEFTGHVINSHRGLSLKNVKVQVYFVSEDHKLIDTYTFVVGNGDVDPGGQASFGKKQERVKGFKWYRFLLMYEWE
jgi:Tol biopolymer transport system component